MAFSGNRPLAAVGPWTQTWLSAARYHCSFRCLCRLLISSYSSLPLHFQFHLSPQYINCSAQLSLPSFSSFHHTFIHHSGTCHGDFGDFLFICFVFWLAQAQQEALLRMGHCLVKGMGYCCFRLSRFRTLWLLKSPLDFHR